MDEEKGDGGREISCFLDKHHFSFQETLAAVACNAEGRGGGGEGGAENERRREDGGRRGCRESIGEEKHALAIMEET